MNAVGAFHERDMAGRVHPPERAAYDWQSVTVWFRWWEVDPLAVELTFVSATLRSRWALSRDVLAAGLDDVAGFGDFTAWPDPPATTSKRSTRTRMILRAPADDDPDGWCPEDEAVVTVVTATLRRALEATFAVVPAGQEYAPGSAAAMVFDAQLFDVAAWSGEGL